MTGNKELFVKLDESITNQVILNDGKAEKIQRKGVTTVNTKIGSQRYIQDALYVPNLAYNLLSIGQLVQKDYRVCFVNNECKIIDKKNKTLIAKVKMIRNKIFL